MLLDEELCLCFHVTKRKVVNFLRVERPQRPGQLSECFGAGTGCGWCRPFLQRLFDEARANRTTEAAERAPPTADMPTPAPGIDEPSAAEYAKRRAAYVRSGGGTPPPGATPIT